MSLMRLAQGGGGRAFICGVQHGIFARGFEAAGILDVDCHVIASTGARNLVAMTLRTQMRESTPQFRRVMTTSHERASGLTYGPDYRFTMCIASRFRL
jgi:hypothetical protein